MIIGILLTLMTLGTALFIAWPFFRSNVDGTNRIDQELAIYKDQLAEVDRDRERGLIGESEADAARAEIGRRIIAIDEADALNAPSVGRAPVLGTFVAICVPFLALAVYLYQGSPTLEQPSQIVAEEQPTRTSLDKSGIIQDLTEAVHQDPNDTESWVSLGNALKSIKRYQQAAVAYTRAMNLAPEIAEYASRSGEAIVFAANGQVTPGAEAAFREAVRRDPDDPRALYYLGLADRQGGRLREALNRWLILENGSQSDAPWLNFLIIQIDRVSKEAGLTSQDLASLREKIKSGDVPVARGPTREQIRAAQEMSEEDRQEMIRGMVDRLADRLRDNPNDAAGWQRLARARMVLGEKEASRDALGKVADLRPRDIEAQIAYADAIVETAAPGTAPADILKPVVDRILARDDRNPQGLWLSGQLALSAGNVKLAKRQWTRLMQYVDPNSPRYVELKQKIDALPEE